MVLRRVLLIGDHRQADFSRVGRWLAEHSLLSKAATPAEAIPAVLHPAQPPELLIVAQSRPGQFAQGDVEALHRLAPLARLAVVAGTWCEGEIRTGAPWNGVLRLYWHQAEARLRELLCDACPLWNYPRTATDVERLLDAPRPAHHGAQKLIAIGTESSLSYQGLAATCESAGYATVWVPPRQLTMVHHPAAGIWDEGHRPDDSQPALAAFLKALAGAPCVALVNFPREVDYQRLQRVGVRQLIAKPFLNSDLLGFLDESSRSAAGHSAAGRSSAGRAVA